MALKQKIATQVATVKVSSFAADVNFTTDIIEWSDIDPFSLSVWFDAVVGSIATSTISIEASNNTNLLSFTPYLTFTNVNLPVLLKENNVFPRYLRIVYKFGAAGAGTTINFDLDKIII